VLCCQGAWGFLAAVASSVTINRYPCSDEASRATDRRLVSVYLRSLFDPATSITSQNGGFQTTLISCGQSASHCAIYWQNNCCIMPEQDNSCQAICTQIFSFGACFALPLSIILASPGLIYAAVRGSQEPTVEFYRLSEEA
jgi:hypothetical protein